MDSIPAVPTIEISLVYRVCGCRDVWLVYQLGAEEAVTTIDVPCVPETCMTCTREGVCLTRRTMENYEPVVWSEIALGGPKKYRRLTAAVA